MAFLVGFTLSVAFAFGLRALLRVLAPWTASSWVGAVAAAIVSTAVATLAGGLAGIVITHPFVPRGGHGMPELAPLLGALFAMPVNLVGLVVGSGASRRTLLASPLRSGSFLERAVATGVAALAVLLVSWWWIVPPLVRWLRPDLR
jgi:hypothetical protein